MDGRHYRLAKLMWTEDITAPLSLNMLMYRLSNAWMEDIALLSVTKHTDV